MGESSPWRGRGSFGSAIQGAGMGRAAVFWGSRLKAVERVAGYRAAEVGQVQPQLVGPACFKVEVDQAVSARRTFRLDPVAGQGRFTLAARADDLPEPRPGGGQ